MKVGAEPSVTSFFVSETVCVSARAWALTVCVVAPVFVTVKPWLACEPASWTNVSLLGPISRLWPVRVPPL